MTNVGVDLGTYNSAAAYMLPDGKVILLQAYHGPTWQGYTIPSFIKFYANGEVEKYGEPARSELEIAPHLVVWGLKRLIGRSYQNAQDEMHRFKYLVEEAEDGSILIPLGNRKYTPIEITMIFLKAVKNDCESDINPIKGRIAKAIVTHPAYFDFNQIKAVRDAAQEVGFDEIELIPEPEAAAVAYKNIIDFKSEPWVMVIDWGAGTLDIAICRFSLSEKGNPGIESIFPPYGDTRLGGIDMDDALFEKVKRLYDLNDISPGEIGKIRSEIEGGKIYLSTNRWVIRYAAYKGKPISLKMARNKEDIPSDEDIEGWIVLENVLNEILEKFKTNLRYALEKDGLTPNDIDQLILVGGPMYMPCVRKAIAEVFYDNEKVKLQLESIEKDGFPVSPLEAVVKGAAIYAGQEIIENEEEKVDTGEKKTPYGYGYLMDNMIGEILMPVGTSGDVRKQPKAPLTKLTRPGESIHISLLKSKDTPDGEEYYKIGDYEFVPVVGQRGANIIPILEMDKDLIVTLTIEDFNSPNPAFALKLSRHQEVDTPRPMPPKEIEMPPGSEEREEFVRRIIEISGRFAREEIPANRIDELRRQGEAYINFIEIGLSQGRRFHNETISCYNRLKQNLQRLPGGALPPEKQPLYQAVSMACGQLKNSLIENDGYTEEEIEL